jgi:hypothetical protein
MAMEHFLAVIQHIGGSRKRLQKDTTDTLHRKIIGRIGIGLLAVAQLSNRFYVTSSANDDPYRFIAEVNLEPFHRDDAALKSMGKIKGEGQVQIGAVRYVDKIPEDPGAHYTVITVPDAKKGLISEMTSAVRKAVGAKERLSIEKHKIKRFEDLVEIVRTSPRADLALDGYYYMLWELGLLCPVNYCENSPFDPSLRSIDNVTTFKPLPVENFTVFVDGLKLQRPQRFPNQCAIQYSSPDPKVYGFKQTKVVSGRRLSFFGYIYSQQPRIDPEEMRGVHIRIRNVGIGMYDKTWLGYPFNEGLKFGQVTGEVFVEDGLEPALNIDRDSFRETDVHYQALRAYIWSYLRTTVFAEFKSRGQAFRDEKKALLKQTALLELAEALEALPAPINPEPTIVASIKTAFLGSWIAVNDSRLQLAKRPWEQFAENAGLATTEQRNRFLRVLAVLVSSEILSDLTDDEVTPLLRALAAAIQ